MFPQLDFTGIQTRSVAERSNKVTRESLARATGGGASFEEFVDNLPRILKAGDLRILAESVANARRAGAPVIWMMGAHVVKVGLAPVLIDLMERGFVTAVAMNSAAAIHDSESALYGATSEDVASNLRDGSFGMWRETGDFINGTLNAAAAGTAMGYGEALGAALHEKGAPHIDNSILAAGVRLDLPVSVHAAIGTDIVHQQPGMDGGATGEMSFRDFRVLAHAIKDLREGAVVLNIGSAVLLPEVFLKALTVVRNLGFPAHNFIAANFDMIQHYRPNVNVVSRPTQGGGRGYTFTGHHELMIPLLAAMIRLAAGRAAQ
ncbi:MAG: hypothetical protein HY962_17280 [Ignavibacteriae bacterium]|nr:hypothetical protein [Ignavibacteriota bacterium]